jgi:hypothetical protein
MAVAPARNHESEHSEGGGHHTPEDPNAAPTHLDVRTDFSFAQMAVIWGLGAVAIVAGIVVGLTVVNN